MLIVRFSHVKTLNLSLGGGSTNTYAENYHSFCELSCYLGSLNSCFHIRFRIAEDF